MELKVLKNVEYAGALVEAIAARQAGTITPAQEDALGLYCYNVAQWALAEWRTSKAYRGVMTEKLADLPENPTRDHDFASDVMLAVLAHVDSVDTGAAPEAAISYLKACASSAIRDLVKKARREKRQRTEVSLDCLVIGADFWGERYDIGTEIEKQQEGDE